MTLVLKVFLFSFSAESVMFTADHLWGRSWQIDTNSHLGRGRLEKWKKSSDVWTQPGNSTKGSLVLQHKVSQDLFLS